MRARAASWSPDSPTPSTRENTMNTINYLTPAQFTRAEKINDLAAEYSNRIHLAEHVVYAMEDPSGPAMTWEDAWLRANTHCRPSPEVRDYVEATSHRIFDRDTRDRTAYQIAKSVVTTIKRAYNRDTKEMMR